MVIPNGPHSEVIQAGSVQIERPYSSTSRNYQSNPKAVIEWEGFSVSSDGAAELVSGGNVAKSSGTPTLSDSGVDLTEAAMQSTALKREIQITILSVSDNKMRCIVVVPISEQLVWPLCGGQCLVLWSELALSFSACWGHQG